MSELATKYNCISRDGTAWHQLNITCATVHTSSSHAAREKAANVCDTLAEGNPWATHSRKRAGESFIAGTLHVMLHSTRRDSKDGKF